MGMVKWESKHDFPEGAVWVLWDAGEEGEYGYEIDCPGEEGHGGNLVTIWNWSFGYEPWSRETWAEWGNYVAMRLEEVEGDDVALGELIKELDAIDCVYASWQPDDEYKPEHLKDLALINKLIAENKHKWEEE
jgi:hypothetical protein